MTAFAALTVFSAFVILDLARFAISRAHGTDEVWTLQQDIRALRASLASATSPRSLAFADRREKLLSHKANQLLRKQRNRKLRRALFVSHYVSVAKAIAGLAVVSRHWGTPLFHVQRDSVLLLGRWLAFPHGLEWEGGAVGVLPWVALSASASVAASGGVAGPGLALLWTLARRGRANEKP